MYKFRRLTAAIIGLVLFFSLASGITSAQTTPTGSGLGISPTLFQFTVKPGQSQSFTITLKNITINSISAQASIDDFTSNNVNGDPQIIANTNQISPNSIRGFVVGLANVPLDVQQQKTVNLTIQIPSGTTPGAYYGIIRYKAVPTNLAAPGANQVSLSASVGAVVLVTVPGNIRQQLELLDLLVYNNGNAGTIFFRKPTQIGVEVKNLGNGFAQPYGVVNVYNIRNKAVYSYQLNNADPRGQVLPNSTRIFTNSIKGINSFGRYTVTASVAYGTGGNVLVLKTTFWYIPLNVLIISLIVLVALVLVAWRAWARYRRDVKRSYRRRE